MSFRLKPYRMRIIVFRREFVASNQGVTLEVASDNGFGIIYAILALAIKRTELGSGNFTSALKMNLTRPRESATHREFDHTSSQDAYRSKEACCRSPVTGFMSW